MKDEVEGYDNDDEKRELGYQIACSAERTNLSVITPYKNDYDEENSLYTVPGNGIDHFGHALTL